MTIYRQAVPDDIDQLVKLRLDCEHEDHDGLPPAEATSLERRYREYLSSHLADDFFIFVASSDEGGPFISTASLLLSERPTSHRLLTNIHALLLHVYTAPAHRRQGHAITLCQMAVEHARQAGASVVELEATEAGQPLYAKIGFVAKDDDCVGMELVLQAFGA